MNEKYGKIIIPILMQHNLIQEEQADEIYNYLNEEIYQDN